MKTPKSLALTRTNNSNNDIETLALFILDYEIRIIYMIMLETKTKLHDYLLELFTG